VVERRCRVRAVSALLLSCVLLAACHKDADEELRKAERSWQATLALVQAEEQKHNVPPIYVKQVREAAAKSLAKARQEAAKK
jgi:hypothetical protein